MIINPEKARGELPLLAAPSDALKSKSFAFQIANFYLSVKY